MRGARWAEVFSCMHGLAGCTSRTGRGLFHVVPPHLRMTVSSRSEASSEKGRERWTVPSRGWLDDSDLSDVSVNGGVHLSRTRLARLARLLPKLRLCGIECLDTRISRIPLSIQLPLMLRES